MALKSKTNKTIPASDLWQEMNWQFTVTLIWIGNWRDYDVEIIHDFSLMIARVGTGTAIAHYYQG